MKNVTSPIHKTEFQNQNVTLLRTVNSIYHLNCSSYAIISCTYLKEIPICWILLLKLENITHSIIFTYLLLWLNCAIRNTIKVYFLATFANRDSVRNTFYITWVKSGNVKLIFLNGRDVHSIPSAYTVASSNIHTYI